MIKGVSQETSCVDPLPRAISPVSAISSKLILLSLTLPSNPLLLPPLCVDESWEQLSVSCLTTTNSIVSREAEAGLIEALRQPGLLRRVVTPPEDTILEEDASGALKPRMWERLTRINVKLTLLLASNVLSLLVGVWLGRRSALANSALPGTLVIRST